MVPLNSWLRTGLFVPMAQVSLMPQPSIMVQPVVSFQRLAVPSDATKSLQRRILVCVLDKLRSHPAATAYERDTSIATNAAPHVGRAVVIKLDVVDFFTATTTDRVRAYFQRIGWSRDAAERHPFPTGARAAQRSTAAGTLAALTLTLGAAWPTIHP